MAHLKTNQTVPQLYLWRRSATGRGLESIVGAEILGQFFPVLHLNLLGISEQRHKNENIMVFTRLSSSLIRKTALIDENASTFGQSEDLTRFML